MCHKVSSAIFIDTKIEVNLGSDMANEISHEKRMVNDPKMQELLERVAKRIAAVSDRKDLSYYFNIVDEKSSMLLLYPEAAFILTAA